MHSTVWVFQSVFNCWPVGGPLGCCLLDIATVVDVRVQNKMTTKNWTSRSATHRHQEVLASHLRTCSPCRALFSPQPSPELEGSLTLRNHRSWAHRLGHRSQVHLAHIIFNHIRHYNSQNSQNQVIAPRNHRSKPKVSSIFLDSSIITTLPQSHLGYNCPCLCPWPVLPYFHRAGKGVLVKPKSIMKFSCSQF